jgi:hypothetical protein
VSQGVVHRLEAVEIQKEERQSLLVALGELDCRAQSLLEGPTIGKPGKGVEPGEGVNVLERLHALSGAPDLSCDLPEVLEHALIPLERPVGEELEDGADPPSISMEGDAGAQSRLPAAWPRRNLGWFWTSSIQIGLRAAARSALDRPTALVEPGGSASQSGRTAFVGDMADLRGSQHPARLAQARIDQADGRPVAPQMMPTVRRSISGSVGDSLAATAASWSRWT